MSKKGEKSTIRMVHGNIVLLILSRKGKGFAPQRSVPDLKPSKDTRNPSQQGRRLSTRQVHSPGVEERAH